MTIKVKNFILSTDHVLLYVDYYKSQIFVNNIII